MHDLGVPHLSFDALDLFPICVMGALFHRLPPHSLPPSKLSPPACLTLLHLVDTKLCFLSHLSSSHQIPNPLPTNLDYLKSIARILLQPLSSQSPTSTNPSATPLPTSMSSPSSAVSLLGSSSPIETPSTFLGSVQRATAPASSASLLPPTLPALSPPPPSSSSSLEVSLISAPREW